MIRVRNCISNRLVDGKFLIYRLVGQCTVTLILLFSSWDAAFNQQPPQQTTPTQSTSIANQIPTTQSSMYPSASAQQNYASGTADFDYQAFNNQAAFNQSNFGTSYDSQTSDMIQAFATQAPQTQPIYQSQPPPPTNFLTPNMWQETVASTYGQGLKRRYNDSGYSSAKKTR